MRSHWLPLLVVMGFMICSIRLPDGALGVEAALEDDTYYISVDPSDPDQGKLDVHGEIDPGQLGLGQTVSVSLSVEVHELKGGKATGRMWHAEVFYDDEAVGGSTKLFKRNDGPEPFTVRFDPSEYNPDLDEGIPVPPGLAEDVEGRMVVTATYTGTGVPSGETTVTAVIYPELYHLINLTTPTSPVSLEAGDRLIYSLSVKNAGNMEENVNIEIPLMEYLDDKGFETSLDTYRFTDLRPGDTFNSTLIIKAPLEIEEDEELELVISAYTDADDPETLEPASTSEITIDLTLKRSKIEIPETPTDTDTDSDNENPHNPTPGPGNDIPAEGMSNPVLLIIGISVLAFILLLLAFFIFRRGGGDGGDDDHSSLVRI